MFLHILVVGFLDVPLNRIHDYCYTPCVRERMSCLLEKMLTETRGQDSRVCPEQTFLKIQQGQLRQFRTTLR